MLEFLGLPVPDRFQGRSVLGQVRGGAESKSEIFYEKDFRSEMKNVPGQDPDRCLLWVVRDDAYKLVQFADEAMPPFLFDLRRDPGEQRNLAEDPAHVPVLLEYSQRLLRWRMRSEDQRMEHWAWPLRQRPD
jgi:arylsulfatase A-like enzyme